MTARSSPTSTHHARERSAWRGATMSTLLLSTALVAPAQAAAPSPFSPAWFVARGAARSTPGAAAATVTPQASLAQVQQSITNLQRAAQAIAAAGAAQAAARAAALTLPSTVPDGLAPGGLQPVPGVVPGDPMWQGANLPVQSGGVQQPTVTVRQTARQAVLTWQTFNVGRHTTLAFDQSAGGAAASTWVALNRVQDPAAQPSQILGAITAPGQVYVINRNGVIFGATVQVNTGALIASAADINTGGFLQNGIYGSNATTPVFTGAAGAITVEAGAQIATNPPTGANSGGGFVLLLGSKVQNAGAISAPQGQVAMAAGRDFAVLAGYGSSSNADPFATVQGNQVAVTAGGGTVTNSGLLQATDGDISLVGHNVIQAGVIAASTGLGQRGTVHLLTDYTDTTASVTLAPGSVTAITIDTSSDTALEALRVQSPTDETGATAEVNTFAGLPDLRDLSRIEITSGGSVQFGAGSLTLASSGQIAVAAKGTVLMAPGAGADVSGLVDVSEPQSANVFQVSIEPFNLRDSPDNRDTTFLNSASVSVDARTLLYVPAENGDSAARYYTGGGLLEVSGELGNVGHTIAEYSTTGGTVEIASPTVVTQPGSGIDIAGGSITYQAGPVPQTWLLGADGGLYNLNNASDNVIYTGVFNGFDETHPHWDVTQNFTNPLIAPATIEEPGYTVGENAGSLTIGLIGAKGAPTVLLAGSIEAGTVIGANQTGNAVAGDTGLLVTQSVVPQGGTLNLANLQFTASLSGQAQILFQAGTSDVVIGPTAPPTQDLTVHSRLPLRQRGTIALSAAMLDQSGLSSVLVETYSSIAVTGSLQVADGGSISLQAPVVHVTAPLVARGGSVTLGEPAAFLSSLASTTLPGTVHDIGVTVADAATIDTRGIWTNALLQPAARGTEAWIDGGAVTIQSTGSITLAAGTAIDASAGGYVSVSGSITGGAGGNIALLADSAVASVIPVVPGPSQKGALTLDGSVRSMGVTQGGTLTLQAPGIAIGNGLSPGYFGELVLSPSLFASGFSDYVITSATNLRVAPGTQLDVVEPVYQATTLSALVPGGSDPDSAFRIYLPPLFLPDPTTARLTQRVGASTTLNAPGETESVNATLPPEPAKPFGNITLGSGGLISVDPGQSVVLDASLGATVLGSITALGGTIEVLDTDTTASEGSNQILGRAELLIGPAARLDAAAVAATVPDAHGRTYGIVTPGGSIVLGSAAGTNASGQQNATDAPIIISSGATLDASGAGAAINLDAGLSGTSPDVAAIVQDDTAGGTVRLASYTGIFPDGTLRAAAGGPTAAGGTLDIVLETGIYPEANHFISGTIPASEDPYLVPRTIVVSATQAPTPAAVSRPGAVALPVGTAEISAAAIDGGGFGTVSLVARDGIVFKGNVDLSVAQAITLSTDALADSAGRSRVTISAPYVLASEPPPPSTSGNFGVPYLGVPTTTRTRSTLTIDADLLDIQGGMTIGSTGKILIANSQGASPTVTLPGFDHVSLDSSGDIRFLSNPAGASTPTTVQTYRDLSMIAAQVYPVTGATADIEAGLFVDKIPIGQGFSQTVVFDNPRAILAIARSGSADPAAPLSAFGDLTLAAATIEQGGILRAPFGSLTVGASVVVQSSTIAPASVTFLPGSITSVSAAGLSIPYGGTTDGINYDYAGGAVTFLSSTEVPGSPPSVDYGIKITGGAVAIENGATLDVHGGGTLTGAGFLPGQGGSTDSLLSPLLSFGSHGVTAPSLGGADAVYALLPSYRTGYAPPAQPDAGGGSGSLPGIGQTVTVGAGVPGLPAGTYTLLPSYYALQPGGYRIELRTATPAPLAGTQALPNGSYLAAVNAGIANTGVLSAVPVSAIITPADSVRRYTQYNEEGYASFATAQVSVAVFGDPRPVLPQDAGELDFAFALESGHKPALINDGSELLEPAPGGYGGTLAVYANDTADSLVIGTARTPVPVTTAGQPGTIVVDAAALDAVDPANLVIGGIESLQAVPPIGLEVQVVANANNVTVASGASLTAPQIVLAADGLITVASGGTAESIGRNGTFLDSSTGLRFSVKGQNAAGSLVAVSNGDMLFEPQTGSGGGGIRIAPAATLYAAGTLAFVTTQPISLSPDARLGARSFDATATDINIGQEGQVPRAVAPPGLLLTQQLLDTLLAGNPGAGVPALQTLDLTASGSVNFFGSTELNATNPATGQSSLALFVLNTPGLYGLGSGDDAAVLNVGTLYWNGVASISVPNSSNQQTVTVDQPPLVAADGPGTGSGALDINAQTIVFGSGPNDVPQSIASVPRAVFGFSTVNLSATQQIVAADLGSLQVDQTQGARQPDGTLAGSGGALHITTPLLTAASNGTLDVTVGGALTLAPGLGAAPATVRPDAAGGEIALTAGSIDDGTAITLPSGRVLLSAASDVTLEPGARIDVAGEDKTIIDQTVSGPGGTVALTSTGGNVTALPGSAIAFGGTGNQDGGTLSVSAAQGTADVQAALQGGGVDAADSGAFTLDARVLPSFATLNQALTAGGVFGARSFEIGSGDLTIDSADQLRAHAINVSVDAGSLTVDGLVDASGTQVGTIALAGGTGLTLAGSAVLAAQGSVLVTDSYGVAIDAENRAEVSLTAAAGTLTLAPGATIALDSADAVPGGDLELNAPRVSATGGGIAVSASGSLAISGAATIALNGFWSYHPADGTIVQDNLTANGQTIDPNGIGLDQIDLQNKAFETAALASAAAAHADAGLAAYASAFHLRPGVIIDSAATSNGNLSVDGDLDLAGLRYGPAATGNGAGEPAVLVLRAAGNLGIYGSISDGFQTPPATPDQAGWMLKPGSAKMAVTVLTSTTLEAGTSFTNNDLALGYPVALKGGTINAAMAVPVSVTLAAAVTLTRAWTTTAPLTMADGQTIAAGQTLQKGEKLPAGTVLAAGSTLPNNFGVGPISAWPAGASLATFTGSVTLAANLVLTPGETIPGGTNVVLPRHKAEPTRPVNGPNGAQGQIDALAAMLPPGSLSWSIGLVAGANLAGAAADAVVPLSQVGTAGRTTTSGDILLDDPHYGVQENGLQGPLGFSVIRTGTGALSLDAGGSIEQQSPYGIYTAGTQSSDVAAADEPRAVTTAGVLGGAAYRAAVKQQIQEGYQPYYPTDGGDLAVDAQGNVALFYGGTGGFFGSGPGDSTDPATTNADSATEGWLWEQGTSTRAASYWINFGSYQQTDQLVPGAKASPPIVGFTGFGTLGGGNLSLRAGGDVGAVADPLVPNADGLVVAVGSSGRVTGVQQNGTVVTGGALVQTGGGELTLQAGGAVLGPDSSSTTSPGVLTDTRGSIDVNAGSVGVVQPVYGSDTFDPRFITSVLNAETAYVNDGVTLAIGDGVASVTARGDLSLVDAVDPGRMGDNFFVTQGSTAGVADVRYIGFSLWQAGSGIDLVSAGGNVSPNTNGAFVQNDTGGARGLDPEGLDEYPPTLDVSAQHGSLYFVTNTVRGAGMPIELAPSAAGGMSLLAGQSIYGPAIISESGAPAGVNDLPNPFKPVSAVSHLASPVGNQTNATDSVILSSGVPDATSLFAFEFDTPTGPLHPAGTAPIRVYASAGDIVNLTVGQVINVSLTGTLDWYSGSLPTLVIAGDDLVNFGQVGNGIGFGVGLTAALTASSGLFVNDYPTDVSVLEAGRDIIEANADVAGPGLLYIQAGRDLYQGVNFSGVQGANRVGVQGVITSLGQQVVNDSIPPSDSTGGASITVLAGVGGTGPDWSAFANLYFNDANQANLNLPLTDPPNAGKVQQTYGLELLAWLRQNLGYTGGQAGALSAFLALPVELQSEFTLPIYFDELRLSGRQFTDPTSRFYKSYVRGKQAIATLFPSGGYQGDVTLFALPPVPGTTTPPLNTGIASAITTNFGGAITVLAPGGGVTLGTTLPGTFPEPYGLLTFGQGDIDIYSLGSVLLGTSRVFTTFGGGITIWSAEGNINAGQGTKSAVVAQPFTLAYDLFGDVTLSPQAPTTGAGIATLNEIPGTQPGDVDLVAPQGTIDAGEAGIRSSGNANLAALAVSNAANIQVQGKTTGIPVVAVPNIGALSAAAAAGNAAQSAAQQAATQSERAPSESIITVEVLSFGG